MTTNAKERRRELATASCGTNFPALGVTADGDSVKSYSFIYHRKRLGALRGAKAEIITGRPITVVFGMISPVSARHAPSTVLITFADGTCHERKLRSGGGGISSPGLMRHAQDQARRFNALAALA
jgi:hypothetical protein